MLKKCFMSILVLMVVVAFAPYLSAEEITIVGTGDGVNVLQSIGNAYSLTHPDVTVNIPESIGSGGGVKAVGNDKYALGRVARNIKDKEKHFGLSYVPYAKVPVVFVVNQNVKVDSLSTQQILDIFSGKITNWADVGGNNATIRVIRREDDDSSFKVLQKQLTGFKDITITEKAKTATSTPENFKVLSEKANTIGFGPNDVAQIANVKCLAIDGKHPTDSRYPLQGTMGLIFKAQNRKGYLDGFLDFATSEAAHKAIKTAGGNPIK